MPNLSQANLIGCLGKDAETITTGNGKEMVKFSLAVSIWNGKEKKANWYSCKMFGNEKIVPYLNKGAHVFISGDLEIAEYESGGQKKMSPNVFVKTIQLLDKKKEAPQGDNQDDNRGYDEQVPF